jgi:hypothetical protein
LILTEWLIEDKVLSRKDSFFDRFGVKKLGEKA